MIKIYINCKINIDNFEKELYNKINRSNKQIFTYKNYLEYEKFISNQSNKNNEVKEDNEKYEIKEKTENKDRNFINNRDDKIFRKMLDIKMETTLFINKILNTNLEEEQLEKYSSSFITSNLENRESDIVYKIKDRNIFFLIEHQTKIDFRMAWRILEYAMEIIKSAIDYNKIGQKNYKLPLVIPIVLYTGKNKWNVKQYIQEVQEKIEGYQELKFGEYTVIDINNYTEEELLEENTYLSKLMLIEKYKKGNDFKKCVEHIVKEINSNNYKYKGKGKEVLIIMFQKILKDIIGRDTELLIKNLKGDDEEMLQIIETLREEREELKIEAIKEGKKEGKREGKTEIIKEMLKRNMPIDLISEITHFSQKKIEKIANS